MMLLSPACFRRRLVCEQGCQGTRITGGDAGRPSGGQEGEGGGGGGLAGQEGSAQQQRALNSVSEVFKFVKIWRDDG